MECHGCGERKVYSVWASNTAAWVLWPVTGEGVGMEVETYVAEWQSFCLLCAEFWVQASWQNPTGNSEVSTLKDSKGKSALWGTGNEATDSLDLETIGVPSAKVSKIHVVPSAKPHSLISVSVCLYLGLAMWPSLLLPTDKTRWLPCSLWVSPPSYVCKRCLDCWAKHQFQSSRQWKKDHPAHCLLWCSHHSNQGQPVGSFIVSYRDHSDSLDQKAVISGRYMKVSWRLVKKYGFTVDLFWMTHLP